jgi:hypothetical protein
MVNKNPEYKLYLEQADRSEKLLMVAKRNIMGDSRYLISIVDEYEKETCIGRVCCNMLGTHFKVFEIGNSGNEAEVGIIEYKTNLTGPKQPRKFNVFIPSINLYGKRNEIPGGTSLREIIDAGNPGRIVIEMRNKAPQWNQGSVVLTRNGYIRT